MSHAHINAALAAALEAEAEVMEQAAEVESRYMNHATLNEARLRAAKAKRLAAAMLRETE